MPGDLSGAEKRGVRAAKSGKVRGCTRVDRVATRGEPRTFSTRGSMGVGERKGGWYNSKVRLGAGSN